MNMFASTEFAIFHNYSITTSQTELTDIQAKSVCRLYGFWVPEATNLAHLVNGLHDLNGLR